MVCKVCGRALERHIAKGTGEESWNHHEQDSLSGHKPVPVPGDSGYLKGRCDFCNDDLGAEKFTLPVRDFIAGRNPVNGKMQGYEGDWMACGNCALLIDGNQWSALIRRVQFRWEKDHQMPAPEDKKTGWAHLYRLVRRNISGSLRPIE
jgi:hypothetical protein